MSKANLDGPSLFLMGKWFSVPRLCSVAFSPDSLSRLGDACLVDMPGRLVLLPKP